MITSQGLGFGMWDFGGRAFAPAASMPRALWKGSIAFGLVNIPVELHTAVRDSRPRFRMLHAQDKSPIRFERVCAREGKPVAWDDLVKGYEYEKGRFIILTKEDFKESLEGAGGRKPARAKKTTARGKKRKAA